MIEDVPVSDDGRVVYRGMDTQFPLCYLKALTRAFLLLSSFFLLFSSLYWKRTQPLLSRHRGDVNALLQWGSLCSLLKIISTQNINKWQDLATGCYNSTAKTSSNKAGLYNFVVTHSPMTFWHARHKVNIYAWAGGDRKYRHIIVFCMYLVSNFHQDAGFTGHCTDKRLHTLKCLIYNRWRQRKLNRQRLVSHCK